MIAIDTNILVYAHRLEPPFHQTAFEVIKNLAEGSSAWGMPWPCVHEFLAVVTSARVFRNPSPLITALNQISLWKQSPSLRFLAEPEGYWEVFTNSCSNAKVTGPKIHDARIAAICQAHGVDEIWTADRDFQRFSGIKAINPLV